MATVYLHKTCAQCVHKNNIPCGNDSLVEQYLHMEAAGKTTLYLSEFLAENCLSYRREEVNK